MVLCPFAFRANNFSNVGSSCFNTECKYQPRRRHKEEEDGRLGTQSIEVHVVKKLRLGADLRCFEGKRRFSRFASKLCRAQMRLHGVQHGVTRSQEEHWQRRILGRLAYGHAVVQPQHAGWPVTQWHEKLLRSKRGLSSMRRTSKRRSFQS